MCASITFFSDPWNCNNMIIYALNVLIILKHETGDFIPISNKNILNIAALQIL